MGKTSREKGKRGEREVAAFLRANGYDAHRGVQYQGGKDSPDVVGLPGVHIEVKRTNRLALWDALSQSVSDAGEDEMPVVFHRPDNCPWVVIMYAKDWIQIYREWEAGNETQG